MPIFTYKKNGKENGIWAYHIFRNGKQIDACVSLSLARQIVKAANKRVKVTKRVYTTKFLSDLGIL